jgi:transposase-like protein
MTSKRLLTDVGAVDLAVPGDRNGRFDPKIVRKTWHPAHPGQFESVLSSGNQ